MDEYIKREQLKRRMNFDEQDIIKIDGKVFVNFEIVKIAVEYTHTADVIEVVHAYWKWEKKIEPQAQNRLYCSRCDKECLSKGSYYVTSDYCPHCGAKMDGERKDQI